MHNDMACENDESDSLEGFSELSDERVIKAKEQEQKNVHSEDNLLKNWPLMSTIIVYCVFSLQEIAYAEVNSRHVILLLWILHFQCAPLIQVSLFLGHLFVPPTIIFQF